MPAASLYLEVDAATHEIRGFESRAEWITIASNLSALIGLAVDLGADD